MLDMYRPMPESIMIERFPWISAPIPVIEFILNLEMSFAECSKIILVTNIKNAKRYASV